MPKMNKIDAFFNWIDYKCPKPIRWLLYAVLGILGICFFLILIEIAFCIGALFFEIIPSKLQELGQGWAVAIYFVFVFPVFLVILYGFIYLIIKIFGFK
jgi:predicted membrane channel-forming protein YqfA (hemolysin III family)